MPQQLVREVFTEDNLAEVQNFDCGSQPYQQEISDWLKGPKGADSAITSIHNTERPCRVWLYRLEEGELVGFGALGHSRWRWTGKKDPFVPLTIITWCGIQRQFWGMPKGNKNDRFSHQIMEDLITSAMNNLETHPILGLAVRPENLAAIKLYKEYEFLEDLHPYTDKETGVTYNRMALILDLKAVDRIREEAAKK